MMIILEQLVLLAASPLTIRKPPRGPSCLPDLKQTGAWANRWPPRRDFPVRRPLREQGVLLSPHLPHRCPLASIQDRSGAGRKGIHGDP